MFEVQDLKYATLATVSLFGMIWFSEHVLSIDMIFENYFNRLSNIQLEESEEGNKHEIASETLEESPIIRQQRMIATVLRNYLT
jgi:dynein heavy chain 1